MFNLYKNEMQQVRKPTNLWYKEAKKIDMAVSTLLGPYGMYNLTLPFGLFHTNKTAMA